jgi:hypothetical protein
VATVYFSYRFTEEHLFLKLSGLLQAKGHETRSDREIQVGDSWRDVLNSELLGADAVVVLWSADTGQSPFVAAEVGAARATPNIGLLPVLVGDITTPMFLQDLMCQRIDPGDPDGLRAVTDKLDRAIQHHAERRCRHQKGTPKIFISHRHKDEDIVEALVQCIKTSFTVTRDDIRCTSVAPYRLRAGEDTADRLRSEISTAEVVLGVISTDTLRSSYVAFELGSAWGQRIWTCPLLVRGATYAHIPDPIRGLAPLSLSIERDCTQLLEDLARGTTFTQNVVGHRPTLAKQVRRLACVAAAKERDPEEPSDPRRLASGSG